jgi:hypothetical protein
LPNIIYLAGRQKAGAKSRKMVMQLRSAKKQNPVSPSITPNVSLSAPHLGPNQPILGFPILGRIPILIKWTGSHRYDLGVSLACLLVLVAFVAEYVESTPYGKFTKVVHRGV